MERKIGSWTFIAGAIIAIIIGIFKSSFDPSVLDVLSSILILLGLIVGYLNVAGKETKDFLFATTVLVIVAGFGSGAQALSSIDVTGQYLTDVLESLLIFVVPATIVVALKEVYYIAKSS